MNDQAESANVQNLPDYVRDFQERNAHRRSDDESAVAPIWLITFTDIMALMLTFFVLLYSMAQPDELKWEDMTGAMQRQFNEYYAREFQAGSLEALDLDKIDFRSALNLGYLQGLLQESLRDNEGAQDIVFLPQRDVLILSMPENLFFESGQAEVGAEGKKMLFTLGGILSRIRNKIEVVGHSDPRPIQSEGNPYDSNWALSLARAENVADILQDVGYERPIAFRGASSARFYDLPENLPEEDRQSLSRRVDINILKNDGREMLFMGP